MKRLKLLPGKSPAQTWIETLQTKAWKRKQKSNLHGVGQLLWPKNQSDAVWEKVSASLALQNQSQIHDHSLHIGQDVQDVQDLQQSPLHRPGPGWIKNARFPKKNLFLPLGLATSLATTLMVTFALWDSAEHRPEVGIKGTDTSQKIAGNARLRFAVVQKANSILPGYDGMTIELGQSLIFSVESDSILIDQNPKIAVVCKDSTGNQTEVVRSYTLREKAEQLRQGSSYLAFRPKSRGLHSCLLNLTTQGPKDQHERISSSSFEVHVR